MAVGLLDSSILIDFLRSNQDTKNWLGSTSGQLGITQFVWMEVLEGAISKKHQASATALLNRFEVVAVAQADLDWTVEKLSELVPKYNGLGMKDVLIASTSYRLQIPIYTRNMKHFKPLLGSLVVKPY
jgi:predicted nucleic acid-binding protein